MIERYIRQLEAALADTWHVLEEEFERLQEAGLTCTLDDLMDRHRDAIERAKEETAGNHGPKLNRRA